MLLPKTDKLVESYLNTVPQDQRHKLVRIEHLEDYAGLKVSFSDGGALFLTASQVLQAEEDFNRKLAEAWRE